MRSVAEAILHLAPNPDGFTVQELADEVRPSLPVARDAYPGRQAACDLMKLRGKRLIERIAKKRRYRPPPMRISILAGWLILREKVIKPLRTPTHYTSTWIDVSKEPWILSLPDMKERHFLFLMLDGWTNVFQVPGKRNTGTKAQTYAITGPGWTGKLPASVTEYKSPTGLVWILGRIYSSGPPADYKEVHALQDKVSVVPLSAYEKPYSPAPGTVDPAIDMAGAPKPAQELIMGGLKGGTVAGDSKLENGWLFSTKVGQYGTSYVQRALVTAIGLGANRPEVAVYPTSKGPDIAARYSGEKKYVMHFEKGQQPPVNGFWSLTRYDSDYFFFDSMRNDRLPRGAQPSIVATFPHEGPSEAPGVDIMNHPNTLSVAQSHGGQDQRGAGGAVGSSAWRALQKLLAGLCEPAQSTCRNPAAYPATFINLP